MAPIQIVESGSGSDEVACDGRMPVRSGSSEAPTELGVGGLGLGQADASVLEVVSPGECLSQMGVMAWHPYSQQRLAVQKMLSRARTRRFMTELHEQREAMAEFHGFQP